MRLFWNLSVTILGQNYTLLGLPWSADLIFVTAFFLLIGYRLRLHVHHFRPSIFGLGISLAAFASLHFVCDDTLDLNLRR